MNEKYIPLYRKYRPQKLEELVGQEHIKNALSNAIELNKISHAYLFTGPRGTGKTSTARIFAKSLNCKNGPTISPCGDCESCVDITNAVPMDVIEIDAASNRKVEDTQNILEKILYAPVYGKYKIYIIDEVHMLSNTAFNSLLKTLEEPPENVIFILATTEVHKVLDTIKSRCQRFDFRRITTSDIVKHLRYISDKEGINITDDALFTIAKNSAGGMRDSIALLDQLSVLGGKDAISTDDINSLLGRISFDVLNSLSSSILASQPHVAIETLEAVYNSGNEPVQIFSNLLDYLKNLLIVKNCREDIIFELTQLNEAQLKILKEQAQNVETHQLVALLDKCASYIKELKLTNNPRLWLEVGIIDLANLAENTTLAELQKRISLLENGETPSHPHVSSYKTPPAPVAKPEVMNKSVERVSTPEPVEVVEEKTPEKVETKLEEFSPMPKAQSVDSSTDIGSLWGQLIDNISSPPTKSLLKQWANPVELTPEKVVISINSENLLKQFVEGNKRTILIQAVNNLFGQENSNVLVRLPQPDDKIIKEKTPLPKPKAALPPVQPEKKVEDIPADDEIQEGREEVRLTNSIPSMHSDTVNMVVDLFDGKLID
ncbi:DNA polymerase III subunit gamma/tau [bacterium]|nr:DNA polymerase III subunit gamma/tau [bacterium]